MFLYRDSELVLAHSLPRLQVSRALEGERLKVQAEEADVYKEKKEVTLISLLLFQYSGRFTLCRLLDDVGRLRLVHERRGEGGTADVGGVLHDVNGLAARVEREQAAHAETGGTFSTVLMTTVLTV